MVVHISLGRYQLGNNNHELEREGDVTMQSVSIVADELSFSINRRELTCRGLWPMSRRLCWDTNTVTSKKIATKQTMETWMQVADDSMQVETPTTSLETNQFLQGDHEIALVIL